jgi:hypothetical protein
MLAQPVSTTLSRKGDRMLRVFALAAALAVALPSAPGAQTTAKQLGEWCGPLRDLEAQDGRVKVPQNFGAGYCMGLFDGLRFEGTLRGGGSARFCVPQGTNVLMLIRAFVTYLEANQNDAGTSALAVARRALMRSYPCRTQQL